MGWAWGRVAGGNMEDSFSFSKNFIAFFLILLDVVGFGFN